MPDIGATLTAYRSRFQFRDPLVTIACVPVEPERPTRVLLDTNVVLAAAFSLRSHINVLLEHGDVEAVITSGVLDEVHRQVDKAAVDDAARLGARLLIQTLLVEHRIEVVDVYVPSVEGGDLHHARAARALGCDWICTYDSDFSNPAMPPGTPAAVTPLGLLRRLDPRTYLVENPRLGTAGTLVIMGRRQLGQSRRAVILVSDNGTRVYAGTDGFVIAEAVGQQPLRSRFAVPPPWHSFVLTVRYGDGHVALDLWVDSDRRYVPKGGRPDANGRVALLNDNAPFGSSSRVVVSGEFIGELHGMAGVDRRVKDGELRKAIDAATFDHARSPGVDDLLERIEIDRAAADDRLGVVVVTLRSPNERGHFPFAR